MILFLTLGLLAAALIAACFGISLWLSNSPFASRFRRAGGVKRPYFAVIVSGDGLLTPLATGLAKRLSGMGVATSKTKAVRYFWARRSPRTMSIDLATVLRRRLRRHPGDRFILIGYSFGAGTLPFAVNRLPDHLKSRIVRVAILAAPAQADFEFYFRSWFHQSSAKALPSAPEIIALSQKTSLIYLKGVEDYDGPRDALAGVPTVQTVVLPGGHDFDDDFDRLVDLIIAPLNLRVE